MTESARPLGVILTLAIMFIGLAIIVGGSGLLGVLFAPLVRVVRKILGAVILALVCAWLLLSVLSGLRDYGKSDSGRSAGSTSGSVGVSTSVAGQ